MFTAELQERSTLEEKGLQLTKEDYEIMRRGGERYLWKCYRNAKYYEELKEYLNEAIYLIWKKYDPDRGILLSTFFYRAFANAVISYIRIHFGLQRENNFKPTMASSNEEYLKALVDPEPNAAERYDQSLKLRWVYERLGELSSEQRESFLSRHYKGLTLEEIAVSAGVNRSTILWRSSRALKYLRSCLRQEQLVEGVS